MNEIASPRKPKWNGRLPLYVLLALSLAMPGVLVFHSVFASRELGNMRSVLLRDRAASLAARLEATNPGQVDAGQFEPLFESDPALLAVAVFRQSEPADPAVDAIRTGRELYRTEELRSGSVFRAYVPIHVDGEVRVARIDLSPAATDLVLAHARRNLVMALATGGLLLLLSGVAIWSMRAASRLERRRLEMERLAELGTMSAVLAHEIRNPLGAIKGFAQFARETAEGGSVKALDTIVRESLRLERLVEALLLYGRPVKPQIGITEWEPLAEELEANARALIGARHVRFSRTAEFTRITTDGGILKQALLNLLRNAVEAIPDDQAGEVRLRAAAGSDGIVRISVEDNGPGIPAAIRPKLFLPFTTTKASGTGLGLSVSKKLVETLGGALRLADAQPGTRAEVELYGANPRN